jgi:D-alanyl-D-alanine dipeptidase|tara:strand:- start:1017 stop:1751 length:735 start_codon:yes stop_codon:yes gene_type:complete
MNLKIVIKYNILVHKKSVLALLFGLCILQGEQHAMAQNNDATAPDSFLELQEFIPDIQLDLRYFSEDNFVGQVIDGYHAEKAFMTREAATALSNVQGELAPFGMSLKVFDAYRPQRAVDHFVRWGQDLGDKKMKDVFYPAVAKEDLFSDGYIAQRSGHSRGSTIDLTIVDLETGEELEMGTLWDFFDPSSWPSNLNIPPQARANRNLLNAVMTRHGFTALGTEWWHFTLENEPFLDTYFNFPVK